MKKISKSDIVFITLIYFCVYWITAFPASLYLEGDHDKTNEYFYNLNENIFILKNVLISIGLDLILNSFIFLIVLCVIMAVITLFLFNLIVYLFSYLQNKK